MNTTRRQAGKTLTAVAFGVAGLGLGPLAHAQATIKVGVLHSLSGTMAISETVLKDEAAVILGRNGVGKTRAAGRRSRRSFSSCSRC